METVLDEPMEQPTQGLIFDEPQGKGFQNIKNIPISRRYLAATTTSHTHPQAY